MGFEGFLNGFGGFMAAHGWWAVPAIIVLLVLITWLSARARAQRRRAGARMSLEAYAAIAIAEVQGAAERAAANDDPGAGATPGAPEHSTGN